MSSTKIACPRPRRACESNEGAGKILLIAATHQEITDTIDRLGLRTQNKCFEGRLADRSLIAVVSGIGGKRVRQVLVDVIQAHQIHHVIHLGFAGGLDPKLRPGQVLRVKTIAHESETAIHLNGACPQQIDPTAPRAEGPDLLTVDRLVHSVAEKQKLKQLHGAAAVDMETHYVAQCAMNHGLRLSVVRAIIDTADMTLPRHADKWTPDDGTVNLASVARFAMTHPWQISTLWKLKLRAKLASQQLANEVMRILENNGRSSIS